MQGETILCVATRRWHSMWRSTQQMMSRLAAHNRVLFFEPGRNPDRPVIHEVVRNLPNVCALRTYTAQPNLIVVPTPPSLTLARRYLPTPVLRVTMPLAVRLNALILLRQIRWATAILDVKDPILWVYEPYHADLLGRCGERLSCYHSYDEHADFPGNEHIRDLMLAAERRLLERVDVVFASSQTQWERRKAINPNTFFIPNAVDFDSFNRAVSAKLPLPPDIAAVPRPLIGFTGWLGYQIDVELLGRVARAFPDCSLVLVGPDKLPNGEGLRRLRALPNVFFLGQKEREDLPSYLQAFDVALIPWLRTGHTVSAYPLKLHEYLAAGRAVVATALPELRPFGHVVRIAESDDQFIVQTREALCDHSPESIAARVEVARANTWDARVADACAILDGFLSTS